MAQLGFRVHCVAFTAKQRERALLHWDKALSFSQMDIAPLLPRTPLPKKAPGGDDQEIP